MTWEPEWDVWDITVEDGKYRIVSEKPPSASGGNLAGKKGYRNGEQNEALTALIRNMAFSKSFAALMTEFNTARAALRILRDKNYMALVEDEWGYNATDEERQIIETAYAQAKQGERT